MKRAFIDIFFSAFVVTLGLFLAHFMMRQNGLSRPVDNAPLGWWSNHLIVAQEYAGGEFDFAKIDSLNSKYSDLNVRIVSQITIPSGTKEPRLKLVKNLLASSSSQPLIINVLDYAFGIDKNLIDVIKGTHAQERIIIRSPYDNIIREVRRQEPKWYLGSGDGEGSRLFVMSSLALESFPPLSGNFYFLNFIKKSKYISDRMLAELRRRQLIIFAEVPSSETLWQKALEDGATGIITDSAIKFLEWYKSRTL